MREITPGLTCEVTEDEFNEGLHGNFNVVYIIGNNGECFKQVQLQNGGYVRHPVQAVPGGPKSTKKELLTEDVNFLPAGKVPRALLDEIVAFFKQVMVKLSVSANVNHATNLEAMAHVLWNPEQGYHIGIPTQKVTGASVNYDFDDVKEGDMIVLDIHSHNSMGAFFSGTDDRDDARGVWISGVVGKLSAAGTTYDTVWRFNFEKFKKKLSMDDIFTSVSDIVVPEEWLDKVSKPTFKGYSGNRGANRPGVQFGSSLHDIHDIDDPFSPLYTGRYSSRTKPRVKLKDVQGKKPQALGLGANQNSLISDASAIGGVIKSKNPVTGDFVYHDRTGRRVTPEDPSDPKTDYRIMTTTDAAREDAIAMGLVDLEDADGLFEDGVPLDFDDVNSFNELEMLEEMASVHDGETVEDAVIQIGLYLQDLEDDDESLMSVVTDAYDALSEDGKAKIATNGL